MANPEEKAREIEKLLTDISGKDRMSVIKSGDQCTMCETPNMDFREKIDRLEYEISGLCQSCQDKVFGDGSEDGD